MVLRGFLWNWLIWKEFSPTKPAGSRPCFFSDQLVSSMTRHQPGWLHKNPRRTIKIDFKNFTTCKGVLYILEFPEMMGVTQPMGAIFISEVRFPMVMYCRPLESGQNPSFLHRLLAAFGMNVIGREPLRGGYVQPM